MTDCCQKPNVATLSLDSHAIRNLVCLTCRTHWYGLDGEVKQYTRREWDALMELPAMEAA